MTETAILVPPPWRLPVPAGFTPLPERGDLGADLVWHEDGFRSIRTVQRVVHVVEHLMSDRPAARAVMRDMAEDCARFATEAGCLYAGPVVIEALPDLDPTPWEPPSRWWRLWHLWVLDPWRRARRGILGSFLDAWREPPPPPPVVTLRASRRTA